MTESGAYKDTINLLKTDFEMRANAKVREPQLQEFWRQQDIYNYLASHNPGEPFILHDGPPYANGSLHVGHALNKILKDFINKFQLLQGRKVRYIPGWDCHGLPIELKVLQSLKPAERSGLSPLELRHKARDFALGAVADQSRDFQRYGVWGEWADPYLTLKPAYEAAQIGVFGQMVLAGHIYRGRKPVYWSPSSQTALAEAELEYPDTHVSPSIYVAFTVQTLSPALHKALHPYLGELAVAVWTTTPWTIPANLAVSVNPELVYAVVEVGRAEQLGVLPYLIVARDLVDTLSQTLETPLEVKATLLGKTLEHCTYVHPLYGRSSFVVLGGDYITTESGTGLVHTAPGHGMEDYQTGLTYGLPAFAPVDEQGNFTAEAGPFEGLNVLKEGNQAVIAALQAAGALLREVPYSHKYPYDWRTKQPTIVRATEQWFASVSGFREAALQAIAQVQWLPSQGENRIRAMVAERSDWCISRQRSWGVPIPVFYQLETGEPLLNSDTIQHVQAIFAERGSDAWWEMSVDELLPLAYRGQPYRKGTDTMDVWFDSGSSWAAVLQAGGLACPADLYLEGSDQHRGWFQSSLLTSVAAQGQAPYRQVLTHGFALDEKGLKMSKSLGNVVDPKIVIEGGKNLQTEPAYGADVLRLWVASVDYRGDVLIGKGILRQMADVYRKVRNTARYLLGNLHDFDPKQDAVALGQLPQLDRYLLQRLGEVVEEITTAYSNYAFDRVFQAVQNFCVVDLSNFYLDIAKDRLYISAPKAWRRRSCQTVLQIVLESLARLIAPILSHLAEDIWQHLPYPQSHPSVFLAGWVAVDPAWSAPELVGPWTQLRQVRTEVNRFLEQARASQGLGAPLEAKVSLCSPDPQVQGWLRQLVPADPLASNRVDDLRYILIVSQVEVIAPPPSELPDGGLVRVVVERAKGSKCERCWNYSLRVGASPAHPSLCERCLQALDGHF